MVEETYVNTRILTVSLTVKQMLEEVRLAQAFLICVWSMAVVTDASTRMNMVSLCVSQVLYMARLVIQRCAKPMAEATDASTRMNMVRSIANLAVHTARLAQAIRRCALPMAEVIDASTRMKMVSHANQALCAVRLVLVIQQCAKPMVAERDVTCVAKEYPIRERWHLDTTLTQLFRCVAMRFNA
jgi:hypothetical protein